METDLFHRLYIFLVGLALFLSCSALIINLTRYQDDSHLQELKTTMLNISTRLDDVERNLETFQKESVKNYTKLEQQLELAEQSVATTRLLLSENRTLLETFEIVGVIGNKVYLLEKEDKRTAVNFDDAQNFCSKHNSKMATIKSSQEKTVIWQFFRFKSWTLPLWIGLKVETQRSWVRVATRKFVWFQETSNQTVYEPSGYFRTGDVTTQYFRSGIQRSIPFVRPPFVRPPPLGSSEGVKLDETDEFGTGQCGAAFFPLNVENDVPKIWSSPCTQKFYPLCQVNLNDNAKIENARPVPTFPTWGGGWRRKT